MPAAAPSWQCGPSVAAADPAAFRKRRPTPPYQDPAGNRTEAHKPPSRAERSSVSTAP